MIQSVTLGKKRPIRTCQKSSNTLKEENNDIGNKCLKENVTRRPDKKFNNENALVRSGKFITISDSFKESTENVTNVQELDSITPRKKQKYVLSESANISSTNCNLAQGPSKIVKNVDKLHTSIKNKSDLMNNFNISFTSSIMTSFQALGEVSSQKRLELSSWGIPPLILEKYQARGIKTMFPWQVECLANRKILQENKNLVYSAPTSAGKTLVAEFLVLKTVLEQRKKAIFILPFVSVVREKMFYFQDLLEDSGIRVEGFMGGVSPSGGFAAVHIAIATIEKANSLINHLMENGDLSTLGAVVIDELHLLGDPGRGYLLELLLTKLRYMSLSLENVTIQLIGMSATLPNLPLIAEWLDAELYKTNFRPIPLVEQCKIGSCLYDSNMKVTKELVAAPDIVNDTDNIIQLCIETINDGNGILIFCPTKNWCEKLATQIASNFYQLGRDNTTNGQILRCNLNASSVEEVLAQLEHCPAGLDKVLKRTVSFGVAFHHAGLTMDERDIIEGGFRVGSLKVLIATSTLSSGVNLPARRVIIRSPIFHGRPLDKLTYQQMIGRAGRMGKDTAGESILVCKENERSVALDLMTSTLEPITSCLEDSGPLIRALLEAIASEVVSTPKQLAFYSKCTFVYKCEEINVKNMVDEAVEFLVSNEFLQIQNTDGEEQRIVATSLGRACLSASVPPKEGLFLFEELQRARKCFALDTELHVVYLVTPFNSGSQISQIDWMSFIELWRGLSESERRVGQLVGVEERFIMTAVRGIVKAGKALSVHRRFFTALALHDLVQEVPLHTVCKKYNCCRGLLQSLQQSSATFAGMVTSFCKQLKWDCMELLFAQFQARLQFGVCRDLVDLLRLPSLNGLRARSLYKYGITNVAELAAANEFDVEQALEKALPFESEKNFDGENVREIERKSKMRTVFVSGKDGLTAREAAVMIIQEARSLLEHELGVDVRWTNQSTIRENQCSTSIKPSSSVRQSASTSDKEQEQAVGTSKNKPLEEQTTSILELPKCINSEKALECENESAIDQSLSIISEYSSKENKQQTLTNSLRCSFNEKNTEEKVKKNSEIEMNKNHSESLDAVINKSNNSIPNSKNFESMLSNKTKTCIAKNLDVVSQSQEPTSNVNFESFQSNIQDQQLETASNQEQIFRAPAPVDTEKKRISDSSNTSKSPSLFSDSSFLDARICSILEKNVIDSSCFSDFDKSKAVPQNEAAHKPLDTFTGNHLDSHEDNDRTKIYNKTNEVNQMTIPNTWTEDSWDQTKNIQNNREKTNVSNENNDVESPSLLTSRLKGRLKRAASTQVALGKVQSSPLMGSSKSTFQTRALEKNYEQSPISAIKTYNTCKFIKSSVSSNKSDSDDSIVCSQTVNPRKIVNKTRSRIEQKLDQKLIKSAELDSISPKVMSARLLKNVTEPVFEDSNTDDDVESTSSCLLFDSDDTISSQVKRASKLSATKQNDIKLFRDDSGGVVSKHEKINLASIEPINVANSKQLFRKFRSKIQESAAMDIAVAFVLEPCLTELNGGVEIGKRIIGTEEKRKKKSDAYVYKDKKIKGIIFSWGIDSIYYMPFGITQETRITIKERIIFLRDVLTNPSLTLRCFNAMDTFKMFYICCEIDFSCKFIDPKVGDWLMNSDVNSRTYSQMAAKYFPKALDIASNLENNYGTRLIESTEAAIKAVLAWYITESLCKKLKEQSAILLKAFTDVEMPTVTILAKMELRGFAINVAALQELSAVIKQDLAQVEEDAFNLAGRKFNFYSSKEVSQVLGLSKKGRGCTNKNALKSCENPISKLVTLWRKLNTVQTKIIFPLLRVEKVNDRIHGKCITYTVTGRVSMQEPSLQTIPRDFKSDVSGCLLSVRMAFTSGFSDGVLLSADFCQLELRILAHFSQDSTLCKLLQEEGDIFRSIAARLNKVTEESVEDDMRQRAKQLCYAMIYGMGPKSLAENLSITESEAKDYLETFMNTYKGIRIWLKSVVEQVRIEGFVTTLFDRRRIFSGINSPNQAIKAQAERQAVNTKIQGSAADIAKKAMVIIESKLGEKFSNAIPIVPTSQPKRKRRNESQLEFRGGRLILQLHDELLYEVNSQDLDEVAKIVKDSMENSCKLSVPLPVKLKVGSAWGNLEEYQM